METKRILVWMLTMLMIISRLPAVYAADTSTFTVNGMSIEDGAENVSPINLQLDVTFSEAVDESTLTMANISASNGIFASVVVMDEKNIRIYFNRLKIDPGKSYTVTLKSGIKSMSGIPLEEKRVTFTITKESPVYHQMTNQHMDDPNNIYGLDEEAWSRASIISRNGDNVLEFTPGWDDGSVRQRVYCKAGRTYKARAKVYPTSDTRVWLSLTYSTPNGEQYLLNEQKELKSGEWTELEQTFTIGNDADLNGIKQWIAVGNAGVTIYVDDWYFFEDGYDMDMPANTGTAGTVTNVELGNNKLSKMKAFNVISKNASENAEITRLEFAKVLLNILGLNYNLLSDNAAKFRDVADDDWGVVSTISNLGIMVGYNDFTFGSNDTITVDQALKCIISIMGWSMVAENDGGYPTGYRSVAASLGLLRNTDIKYEQPLNYKNLATVLDNALKEKVLNKENENLEKGNTFLEEYFKYAEGEGIIDGTYETYLYSDSYTDKNQVSINGMNYVCDKDLTEFIGCKVKYYYEEARNGDNKLIYVYDIENRNKVVEFSSIDDEMSYENGTYTVWKGKNERSQRYKINSDANVIYNGRYIGEYTEDIFVPKYGYVKLIDNGNGFSTVVITDIRTVHAGSIDYNNEVIYDRLGGEKIDISDCDVLSIRDCDESECELLDIKSFDLLSVVRSKDGKVVKIHFSTNTVEGSVCELSGTDTDEISIAHSLYGSNVRVSHRTVSGFFDNNSVNMGTTGTFYFDYLGNIGAFKSGGSTKNIGYLINAFYSEDAEEELYLKIFNTDGKTVRLKAANKVKIDRISTKTAKKAFELLKMGTNEVVSQLIMYDMDVDGNVSFVDTAYNKKPDCGDYRTVLPENDESKDSFRVVFSSILPPNSAESPEMILFRPNARNFGGKVQLSNDAKILYVPLNAKESDESRFYISDNLWDIGDLGQEMIEAYQTKGGALAVDTVIVYMPDNRYWSNHLGEYRAGVAYDKSFELVDEEACVVLRFLDGKQIYSEDASWGDGIGVGDYIQYRCDKNGRLLEKPTVIIDVSEHTMTGSNPRGGFGNWERAFYANVFERDGSELKIIPVEYEINENTAQLHSEVLNISQAKIYLCNMGKKSTIEKGSIRDIIDYKNSGNSCSEIIVIYQGDIAQYILILN